MSADNFYFIDKDANVFQGFASVWFDMLEVFEPRTAVAKFVQQTRAESVPLFSGESLHDAIVFAEGLVSEYGLWWIEGMSSDQGSLPVSFDEPCYIWLSSDSNDPNVVGEPYVYGSQALPVLPVLNDPPAKFLLIPVEDL